MAKSLRSNRKQEQLPASMFAEISTTARMSLCGLAAKESPRFCLDLLGTLPAKAFVAEIERDSFSDSRDSVASIALSSGRLSLARIGLARLAKEQRGRQGAAPKNDAESEDARSERVAHLFSGQASDEQALRALAWIGGKANTPAEQSRRLDRDARSAFARGRPSIGLALCERLAFHDPMDIAMATLPSLENRTRGHHDPHPMLSHARLSWEESKADRWVEFMDWSRALPRAARDLSGWDYLGVDCRPESLARDSLLGLAGAWVSLLERAGATKIDEGQKARLAEGALRLRAVGASLWERGAVSSPSDYAERFMRSPLSEDAPQIKALGAGSNGQRLSTVHKLWAKAAMAAKTPCGEGILWDAFVAAHESLAIDLRGNPFHSPGGPQCAALWSLAGDGSLISLGLERGFDPRPADSLAVKEGFLGSLAASSTLAAPELGFYRPPSGSGSAHQGLMIVGASQLKPGAAKAKVGQAHGKSGLLHANLATVALLAGFVELASKLVAAGAGLPCAAKGLAEALAANPSQARSLEAKKAEWEKFELGQAVSHAAKKKAKGAESAEPPSRPRPMRI